MATRLKRQNGKFFQTLRPVSLFSQSVERKARDTKMTTRMAEGARRRGFSPAALVSRVSRLCCSTLARTLPSLNLMKKRDRSQSNFSRLHCLAIPKRVEHKENQTKYRKMTRKPRSHVRILIYRTWANVGHCSQRMNIAESKKKYAKYGFRSNSLYCKILTVKQSIRVLLSPLTTASSVIMYLFIECLSDVSSHLVKYLNIKLMHCIASLQKKEILRNNKK